MTSNLDKKKLDDRITEYILADAVPENISKTEVAKQPEFYKIPKRFGSIPVDELPLGCDKEKQYYKIYPRIPLPFQRADRITFGYPEQTPNRLFWGDNLHVMRMLPSNSVDLIYIDPPFFSGRNYNVIFGDQNEIRSFTDIWEGGMPSFLIWMNARLLEMKRLLKQTGSIYLHLDWHASHYVKIEMDKIFGYDNFRNEIIWHYGQRTMHNKKKWNSKHDVILFYAKSDKTIIKNIPTEPWTKEEISEKRARRILFDDDGREYILDNRSVSKGYPAKKQYIDDIIKKGKAIDDVWNMPMILSTSKERLGYPTQKPEYLIERIINASSSPGDVVADFFCGGGTTPCVSQRLGRRWIACDQSRVAVGITQGRIQSLYEEEKSIQSKLIPSPDVSIEYWGNYEIPSLIELSSLDFRYFVIAAYGGRISSSESYIHGYKSDIPLFVGPSSPENRITKEDVISFAREISTKKGKREGVILAWAFAPSAHAAVEKLISEGRAGVDLIKISPIEIESTRFRDHITRLHEDYDSFLTFIIPPLVRFSSQYLGNKTCVFDVSESMAMNNGAKIINVQWDFDFQDRFTPSRGFAYGRDDEGKPLYKVQFTFVRSGKKSIACRIQDDVGGEKIYHDYVIIE